MLKNRFSTMACSILLWVLFSGCANWHSAEQMPPRPERLSADQAQQPNTFLIYVYREASYKGLGRIHLLKIDGKQVGTMGADNYFRIELWPGEYHFAVYLPVENFLGRISPATHSSMQLVIHPTSVPGTTVYKYTDGGGIQRVDSADQVAIANLKEQRFLATSLSARDTAQVKSFYGARYDGPANLGKAHGMGTLTWIDDSVFKGRFEHGEVTTEGMFFFSDGHIYLGPNHKGRPIGPGVLMTQDRKIIYAGKFLDERPHGAGIRPSNNGPEYCEYDTGRDITKTLSQQVRETMEREDQSQSLANLGNPDFLDWQGNSVQSLSAVEAQMPLNQISDQSVHGQANPSHDDRIWAKLNEIELTIRQRMEKQRLWCTNEFMLGRRLCVCAPFAEDFDRWNGCESR